MSDFVKGTLAVLSCQASGIPKPKLTWSKNGHQNIPEAHVKQEGRLLVFPSIQPEHSGVYTCTATNQFGNASTSTNVTVIGKVTCSLCFLVWWSCYVRRTNSPTSCANAGRNVAQGSAIRPKMCASREVYILVRNAYLCLFTAAN